MRIKTIHIETPEKIRFTYNISEIGTRIAAYIMDVVIQILAIVLVLILLFASGALYKDFFSIFDFGSATPDLISLVMAFLFILYFFIQWLYFILFEVLLNGQSPGKKMMKIRVIRSNGEALDFSTIVIRNLLRAVDSFPVFHFLGGLVTMIDKKARRLGDIVADTLVVHELPLYLKEPDFITNARITTLDKSLKMEKKLNEEELYILRRFLNDYEKLPPDNQEKLAANLAEEIRKKLNIQENIADPIYFIKRVYNEHTS